MKTPERHQWRRYGVFIVTFEQISHLFLALSSIVDFKYVFAWQVWSALRNFMKAPVDGTLLTH